MFRESIQKVVDRVDGAIAGILMSADGIAVESYGKDGQALDIQTIGMEFSHIISQVRRAVEMIEVGNLREVIIGADKLQLIVASLNAEYFLAVAVAPDGNLGKARFLVRVVRPQILAEL